MASLYGFFVLLLFLGYALYCPPWLFYILLVLSLVAAPIIWGFTIGFSAYPLDYWKIDIGVMVLFVIMNFIPIITPSFFYLWSWGGQVIYVIIGCALIGFISYFTKEWRLKKQKSKEEMELVEITSDEESFKDSLD